MILFSLAWVQYQRVTCRQTAIQTDGWYCRG